MCPESASETLRTPTADEQHLISRLLAADFAGAAELRLQLNAALVRPIDGDGSLRLVTEDRFRARVPARIPVEAFYSDDDGVVVHVLLHVVDGRLWELEVYREDSKPVLKPVIMAPDLQIEAWPIDGAQ